MIKVYCFKCKIELLELGALLFGPPNDDLVEKRHICRTCYFRMIV